MVIEIAMNTYATIETMALALAAGEVSSVELARTHLARIEALNPELHAFSQTDAEQALAAASRADERRTSGASGPLLGIPLAVKDMFDIAGQRTCAGSRALDDRLPARSATAVRRLEEAGMVILGRTEMVELAYGGWGTNPVRGTPRNPWDREVHRVAGGSSSGSAVAVAAGLVPAALGSDSGGSIRTPASWCGVVGMKTSRGLISIDGVVPLAPSHDSVGPLTRSVRDAALLIEAMSGPDPFDESTLWAPQLNVLQGIEDRIDGLRVGILAGSDLTGVDDAIARHYEEAAKQCVKLGASTAKFRLPRMADHLGFGGDIMSVEAYAMLGPYVERRREEVDPLIAERILRGKSITGAQYYRLLEGRRQGKLALMDSLEGFDAFLLPGSHMQPIPLADVDEARPPNRFGRLVNYFDLASLVLPIGTAHNLPIGLQVVVRKYADALALRIGRALEREVGVGMFVAPAGYAEV